MMRVECTPKQARSDISICSHNSNCGAIQIQKDCQNIAYKFTCSFEPTCTLQKVSLALGAGALIDSHQNSLPSPRRGYQLMKGLRLEEVDGKDVRNAVGRSAL